MTNEEKKEKHLKLWYEWESEFYDKYGDSEILQGEDFQSLAVGFFYCKRVGPRRHI